VIRRRHTIAATLGVCALQAPFAGLAQSTRVPRVGWISLGSSAVTSPFLSAFRQGMRDRGYAEGRNVVIDARLADGSRDRADEMVADLVRSKVDVIVTQGGALRSAIRHAGATPVVMGYSGDPVQAGFVDSLARPGGTRTGMSFLALELVGKRLEILGQVLPAKPKVAIVADPDHPGESTEYQSSRLAARGLGMTLGYFPVRDVKELDSALNAMADDGTQAIVAFPDAFTLDQRERIAAFGLKHRLPTASGWSAYADSGFLLAYGPNLNDSYAHLAGYVDKILKGAKPADLPVELPVSVEFVINTGTAKAIGVKLPQTMLLRANRTVE
jgi:putative tryptophan/tyrosine transport system substrate-binding protein